MTNTKTNTNPPPLLILILVSLLSISSGKILELTGQNFNTHITKYPHTLIYLQPAIKICKQCIATDIQFQKLENNDKLNKTDVVCAKIDVGEYEEIGRRYGVGNAPVLMLFDETFVVKYRGENGAKQIADWVVDYLGNRIVQLGTANIHDFPKPYLVVSGQQQQRILNKALYDVDGITAYHTELQSNGIAIVHKNYTHKYTGQLERIALNSWIEQNIKNSITPLKTNKVNQRILFNQDKPALVILLSSQDKLNHEKYEIFLDVCSQFADRINCGEILPKYQSFVGAHGYFKVKDTKQSIIGFVKEKMNIAYRLDMPIQQTNRISLVNFINAALADQIERIVDNVAPTTAKFNHLKQPTIQQFQNILNNNKYVFVNFYDPTDQASLFFSKPYDSFANIVKSQDQLKFVEVLAVDCVKYREYCEKKKFGYYPVLELFINGVVVGYEKTEKLPQVPDLVKFLHDKVSTKYTELKDDINSEELKLPYIVVSCQRIPKQLQALPALSPITFYHKKSQLSQPQITLYTSQSQKVYKNDQSPQKIITWIKQQTQQLLSNLLTQSPDQKVITAVKNKKPIFIILDADTNRQKGKKHKIEFGLICKKLGVCGGFADGRNTAYRSLLGWIGVEHEEKSRIVYVDVATDRKYLYGGNVQELTLEQFQNFIKNVENGEIRALGLEEQKQEQEQKPEVQEL